MKFTNTLVSVARERGQQLLNLKYIYNQSGATSIEYALIASLISVFILVSVGLAGVSLEDIYTRIGSAFS